MYDKKPDEETLTVEDAVLKKYHRLPSVPGEDLVVTWEAHDLVNGGHLVWIEGTDKIGDRDG